MIDDIANNIEHMKAAWVARCARAVDPRDIGHLVRVCFRGDGDREEIHLRGLLVGKWSVRRDDTTRQLVAVATVHGDKP